MKVSIAKLIAVLGLASCLGSGAAVSISSASAAASGNGVASMSANKIADAALNAMQTVQSVTISGVIHQGRQTIGLNVTSSASGQGQGTVAMNGLRVSIAATGSNVYMKAGSAFWRKSGVPATASSQLSGRWISLSLTDPGASSLSSALNSRTFLGQIPKSTDKGTTFTKVGTTKVNGQPAIKLRGSNPKKPQDNGVLYVATTGAPYVLRITGTGKSSFGTVNFTHYNEPVTVQAPPGALSLSQIEQQG